MIRRWLPLLALACASTAQAEPGEREFTEDMLARFVAAHPGMQLNRKADEELVIQVAKSDQWQDAVINLHRIYGFCLTASKEDCESVKQEFVGKIGIGLPPPSRQSLRIIVRDSEYIDYLRQVGTSAEKTAKYREIGEGLYALLALDGPETIALVMGSTLQELGIGDDEAWTLAAAQTKAILPEIPAETLMQGQAVAFQDQEYLGSLLADKQAWSDIAAQAPKDMFVTAVSDNFVFVAFLPKGPELEDFRKSVAEDCRAQQRCLSPYIYRFQDGRWVIAD